VGEGMMNIDIRALIALTAVHFLADFVLQSNWMAVNKSRRWDALFAHVLTYAGCFLVVFGWKFALITFACHLVTDYYTSRLNARNWAAQETHWFFVGVGLDQMSHVWQLLYTYWWLNS
jgi:hypothetical protein